MTLATRYGLGLCVLGILGCATVGCSADESTQADETSGEKAATRADGLTVVEADEAARRLVLRYSKAGRDVTFEAYIGEELEHKIPREALPAEQWEIEPTHGIDARVIDSDGRAFFGQGNHPGWGGPDEADDDPDELTRLQDMELAVEAGAALRALHVPASLDDGRKAAIQIALALDDQLNPATKDDVQLAPRKIRISQLIDQLGSIDSKLTKPKYTTAVTSGNRVGKSTKSYHWDYIIRTQSVFDGIKLPEHSAVRLRRWFPDHSGISYEWVSCNHGSCAHYSSMHNNCIMSGWRKGTGQRYFFGESSQSTGTRNGGCKTGYGLNGGHSCHSDTLLQIDAAYNNININVSGYSICKKYLLNTPECL